MSRTIQIFGLETPEPLKYSPEQRAELRVSYGVPEGLDNKGLMTILNRLDKIRTSHFDIQNALDGMDIAFGAMDIMRGTRTPIYVPATVGLTMPKPFMFPPDGSTTSAFRHVFEKFAVNAKGFTVEGDLEGEYAHYGERKGPHAMMHGTSDPIDIEDLGMAVQREEFQAFYLIGRHLLHSATNASGTEAPIV